MSHVISWFGFFGAWLLVAGPLDQAVREVEDSEYEHDALAEAALRVEDPPQVSAWWLLLPPVWWFLRSRRESEYRHQIAKELDDRDLLAFLNLRDVVNGWAYVAVGGSLIAVKETWELHEAYEWPTPVFWALVVGMVLFCVSTTGLRHRHRRDRPTVED